MKKRFSIAYMKHSELLSAEKEAAYALSAGFVETSVSLAGDLRPEELMLLRESGLVIEALRLPDEGVNLLWEPSAAATPAEDALPSDEPRADDGTWEMLLSLYRSYFAFAVNLGIERVIFTPAVGTGLPLVSQTALSRFRALAALAREKGVRLLLENDRSAPHFEAAVRVCCEDGYHGVSFSPAKAWRYFGTSALPPYAAEYLFRVSLDDGKGDAFGYLPGDGDTDFRPFARSIASLHFRGTLAVSPNKNLAAYAPLDYFTLASRAYDGLYTLQRLFKKEEGVV